MNPILIDIEAGGYEIGRKGLSAVTHARYVSEVSHNAWMRGWHRGYDEFKAAQVTCISCGHTRERSAQECCGH
jgi:hypothetical protein